MKEARKGCCSGKQRKTEGKQVITALRRREVTCFFSVTSSFSSFSMAKGNGVHIINEGEIRENMYRER